MLTRRQIGLILIIFSIFLSIVGFLKIDWDEYNPKEKESLCKFLLSEAMIESEIIGIDRKPILAPYIYKKGIYYRKWLIFCTILAFVGILLIITDKKPKPSLEEKKSNLEEEK